MSVEFPAYSLEDKRRIAKMARRNVNSEVALIFGAGGSMLFFLLFLFGQRILVPAILFTGLSIPTASILLPFGASTLISLVHARRLRIKVEEAQRLDAEIKYAYARMEKDKREKS